MSLVPGVAAVRSLTASNGIWKELHELSNAKTTEQTEWHIYILEASLLGTKKEQNPSGVVGILENSARPVTSNFGTWGKHERHPQINSTGSAPPTLPG